MTDTPAEAPFVPYEGAVPPPPPPADQVPVGLGPVERLDRALVGLGVALLSATVVMSTVYARADGDLDGSNFVLGVAGALGLLGIALGARRLVRDEARASELMAWPGAFGAVAAGLMVGVLMDDHALTGYVAGGLVVALSAAGYYVLVRRGAFVVSTILGLLVVYTSVVDDLFDVTDFFEESDNPGIIVGAVVLVFAGLVTAAGWVLPETRVLSAVVVGVIAVVSNAGLLVGLALVASFTRAFGGGFTEFDSGSDSGVGSNGFDSEMTIVMDEPSTPYDNDAWAVLVFSLLLVALWAYLTYATGHVGFPLLMAAMCASVIPLVTTVIAVEHPTWWEVVVGLLGGAVLVVAVFRARAPRPPA
jgi:hypothetical protein